MESNKHRVISYFKDHSYNNSIELDNCTLEEAKYFMSSKVKKLKGWGKKVTIIHDGEFHWELDSIHNNSNTIIYQINNYGYIR